ncbi:hypothetical protein [Pseudomonas sp. ML96]|uniref:hypothetical protein n=1 Tax=Pseudomonas sp. ML96 TaxID=1523503 RepID=UPI0005B8D600|nr:hypothetical protein [Pseudomonas sp. ML96]
MTLSSSRQRMTRDQVLVAHAAEMIARTSLSQDRFAQALAGKLHEMTPSKAADAGVPDFQVLAAAGDAAPFLKASASWLKKVQRWLAGEVDLPAWVEEGWVQALDEDYRERCINELAARYGLVGARALGGEACPLTAFGQLVVRLGGAVEAAGAVLADQKIDATDLPLLPEAIERLLAVESRACEIRRQMENVLAQHGQSSALRVVG